MRQRSRRLGFFRLVRCLGDKPIEPVDRVFQHGRKIIGKRIARTGHKLEIRPVHNENAGAPVCSVGSLKVAEYSLDFAFLRKRNRHIEMQSHNATIEVWRSQYTAKFVHVTTLNVDPPPKRDRFGLDERPPAAPKQCNERDIAGARFIEACRFGCARINRRHRQTGRNIAEGMGVAYRKIIQSSLHTCISANGKVRLVPINVKRGAMNAPNPKPFIARLSHRERHCQVVLARFRSAGTRIQDNIGREFIGKVVTIDYVYPLWKPCFKRMVWVPDGLRCERIVVARNEEYRWMRGSVLLKRLCQSFPKVRL